VHNYQLAVFGMMIVQLHQVSPRGHRHAERGQGVLRRELAIPSMANNQGAFAFQQSYRRQICIGSFHGVCARQNREAKAGGKKSFDEHIFITSNGTLGTVPEDGKPKKCTKKGRPKPA
jgi:hypothetical protein